MPREARSLTCMILDAIARVFWCPLVLLACTGTMGGGDDSWDSGWPELDSDVGEDAGFDGEVDVGSDADIDVEGDGDGDGGGDGESCGDGICGVGESCQSCPWDCGDCPPTCGNGDCDEGETCGNCPGDCGVCPPFCGDAACNGDETCASCPGDCGECPLAFTTFFSTRPADDGADTTVEDAIVDLIDSAVPGSRIRIAIYRFTRARVSTALVDAFSLGVDVRIVLDGGADDGDGSEVPVLIAGLGADRVRICDAPGTACVGSGIMHHKTFLFSELDDGSVDVVLQGSHNLTTHQLSLHNNAVVIRGDSALFASYERTFEDLWSDIENPDYYRIDDGDLATRVYYYPRSSGDTVVSVLNNIECDATSRVRVLMAFFTDARLAVAEALADRQREGCDVVAVVGDAEIPIGDDVFDALGAGGVRLVLYPERSGEWTVHSKYLLIDSPYSGSVGHRRLVFTGSHNWTGPALDENDETMLRIEDDGVFDDFMADWQRAHDVASRP